MTSYLERGLSYLLANARGRDAGLFTNRPIFSSMPKPTFTVESPDCGPSGGHLKPEYTQDGASRFPQLSWPSVEGAKEYIIVNEDPDAPFSKPTVHGLYYGIPATKTSVNAEDIEGLIDVPGDNKLKGGFRFGQNRRSIIYIGPRPLLDHGPHRYIFAVIAINDTLNTTNLSNRPTVDEIAGQIDGKIVGWGSWSASYERKSQK